MSELERERRALVQLDRRTQRTLNEARLAGARLEQARDEFHLLIRRSAREGATRTQIAEAVGLSRTRIQQIVSKDAP